MTEFWETAFTKMQMAWGLEPTVSASLARDYFARAGAKDVLIPGIGYGRNAKPFLERGMSVTGIEISATAIALARSFTVISKKAPMYGQGPRLGDDWYERLPGLPMYFYDADSVRREFAPYGLVEISEIDEPSDGGVALPFINVICKRDPVVVA